MSVECGVCMSVECGVCMSVECVRVLYIHIECNHGSDPIQTVLT